MKAASKPQERFPAMKRIVLETECSTQPDRFGRFASSASFWLGSKWAFFWAGIVILVWGITGPVFRYSDTWQLVINTGTTIVTFLMVFLIQNTQNRDARAINLKLDELIRAVDKARNQMMNIEKLSDVELDLLDEQFARLRAAGIKRRADNAAAAD
jgi:low affinity Fe/Cu permease